MHQLTQKTLKDIIHYDPNTGIFTWKIRNIKYFSDIGGKTKYHLQNIWNSRFSLKKAGSVWKQRESSGLEYLTIGIFGDTFRAHRLAFLYMTGNIPCQIDHHDQNGLNNKWKNLRIANDSINSKNKTMRSDNSSGFTGVSFIKKEKKWRVYITIDGDHIYGGSFLDINDAIERRKELNIEYGFHKNHGRRRN